MQLHAASYAVVYKT